MPYANNQFGGHMFNGDPRSLVTGAYACTWPTVPAFRYRIQSDDATEKWDVWNDGGCLVGQGGDITDYRSLLYIQLDAFDRFDLCVLSKNPVGTNEEEYFWRLTWKRVDDPLTVIDDLIVPAGKCNELVRLPNWEAGPSFPGSFGDTARMDPVLWNESEPP